MFVERLDWLAKNPRFTQRFAMHVGALCRERTHTAVAKAERLHDSTVKDLDTIYMQQQVACAAGDRRGRDCHPKGTRLSHRRQRPRPPAAERGRRQGPHRGHLDLFFAALGANKTARIQLAAMDRWKPFRTSLTHHAPQARVIFDKFHIMRHLGDALDEVRRREYRRLAATDRAFIKGQCYTLLSHREHRSLAKLLKANTRLNTAYLLKKSFGQLWSYQTEGWPAPSSSDGTRASRGSGSRPTRRSRR